MKKKPIYLMTIIMLFQGFFSVKVNAEPMKIYVNARSAIAMDSKSKCIMYEKNSDMIVPIASTTKIMTALVALNYGDLDKKVEISEKAAHIRGSVVNYKKGENISIKELLYGLMLRSGNDAAIAIAEGISGSVEEFCKLMNETAYEVGALNTHFESPHGLDSQYHYSTAYDLAVITSKAKEYDLFNKIVSAKDANAEDFGFTRSYHNINKILYKIPAADGVKTGYTGDAGKCLVTSIHQGENDIIIITLNCSDRWNETEKIYNHVNKNYNFNKVASKESNLESIEINKGDKIELAAKKDIVIPMKNNEKYQINIIKPKIIPTEISKGDAFGKITVSKDSTIIYSENLYIKNDIKNNSNNLFQKLKSKFNNK